MSNLRNYLGLRHLKIFLKMLEHLSFKDKNDPNKLDILTETVLPYVNGNLQNINTLVHKINGAVKQLSQDVVSIIQYINKKFIDIKDKINPNIK